MKTKKVAILTPSYNRAYTLPNLFESLKTQTLFDFKWYIVDDGSTDNTKIVVSDFKTEDFEISYIYKENGGKHTALNVGLDNIKEELTFIVDSDDTLTEDAVETIVNDWERYKENEGVAGLCFYKLKTDGTVVGDEFPNSEIIDSYFEVRINQNITGDKAEVYRTQVLQEHKFPVFDGEKFLSEAIVWSNISKSGYKLAYISKGIYVCEYLADGLTKLGRKYRLQNPLGTMEHAKAFIFKDVKFKIRCKYILLYIATSFFSKISLRSAFKQLKTNKFLFVLEFVPAWLLAIYWKRKYGL